MLRPLLAGFFALLMHAPLWAMTAQVTARGEGESRELAVRSAQRAAVEQGLGVALKSESVLKNFMLEQDRVSTISSGVVTSFKVINESQAEGLWTVDINAFVDSDRLQGNIQLLLQQLDNPRSMVIVDPYGRSNAEFARSVHRQLNSYLVRNGFEVVNPEVSQQLRSEVSKLVQSQGAVQAASQMALRYNADVAWMIEVKQRQGEEAYGLRDVIVDAACQVIGSSSGQIFADTEITARGIDAAGAARKAGEQLAQELVNRVRVQFADMAQQGKQYSIRLWGVDSYRQVRAFKKVMQGVKNVEQIKQNSMALDGNKTQNFVDFSLSFKGSADSLIDKIFDGAGADLDSLDLRLQRSTQMEFQL